MRTIEQAVEDALAYVDADGITASSGYAVEGGLYLYAFPQARPVLCIQRREGGDLTRMDVDAVRAALAARGRPEQESWLGMQGVSWLSNGSVFGVSIRIDAGGGDGA